MQQPPGWGPNGYPPNRGYGQQGHGPQPHWPPVQQQAPSRSMNGAATLMIVAVFGTLALGFGGCMLCVCVGAINSPNQNRPVAVSEGQPADGTIGYLHYGSGDTLDVVAI